MNMQRIFLRRAPVVPQSMSAMGRHCTRHLSSTDSADRAIRAAQQSFLRENGYLWIKDFVPQSVARNIQRHINGLLDSFDPDSTKSIFKTHRTDEQHEDDYFLTSGDKIRYFWEEHAFDADGRLKVDARLAVNKIGHALHTLDPIVRSYAYGFLPSVCFDVIGLKRPTPVQSMYITKQPGIGGEVGEHQDSAFLLTVPRPSVHAMWLCIDDTDTSNGCIYVVPGSHADPKVGLRNRFRRTASDANRTEMVPLIGDGSLSKEGGIPLEAKCGDLVLLHGEVVHWSDANGSDKSRHALMVHAVDGTDDTVWAEDNWLQYEAGKQAMPRFTREDVEKEQQTRRKVLEATL